MIRHICLVLALVVLASTGVAGETGSPERIVFLRFEVDSAGATLLKASIVEGILKQPRVPDTTQEILYRVYLDDGSEFMAGSCRDPRIRRFDYEDPDHPGSLRGKIVTLEKAPLVLRLPYHSELSHVDCYRKPTTDAELSKGGERINLGRLDLTRIGEVDYD